MRYPLSRARDSSSQAAAGAKSWLRHRKGRKREKDVSPKNQQLHVAIGAAGIKGNRCRRKARQLHDSEDRQWAASSGPRALQQAVRTPEMIAMWCENPERSKWTERPLFCPVLVFCREQI